MVDRYLSSNKKLKKANSILLIFYIVVLICIFLPITGIAFNTSQLFLGLPVSLLWLTVAIGSFVILSLLSYKYIFSPWAQLVDKDK